MSQRGALKTDGEESGMPVSSWATPKIKKDTKNHKTKWKPKPTQTKKHNKETKKPQPNPKKSSIPKSDS